MKKQIFALGLMLAATFTLTNCAKEMDSITPENEGVAFEIVASTPQVKTVNDGMKTTWKANDAINLFHAVTDGTSYVNDNSFKITADNLAAGKFTGNLTGSLDPQKEYDWYAFYPYSSYIKTPAAQTNGYTYIGGRSDASQSQSGADNMSHIAGSNYPLFGKAEAVPAGSTPNLVMSHASALIEVNVKNSTEAALDVTGISFTAPESIVGTFYPNFAGEDIAYTDATYVSDVANLTVSDASIEAGATASFYLAVKPFVANTGEKLTISVNGCQKELTMTADVKFSAGKIKTLNFVYDAKESVEEGIVTASLVFDSNKANRVSYSTSEQVWSQNDIKFTNSKSSSTTNVADYGNPVRLYKSSKITIEAPGYITKIIFNSAANSGDNTFKDWLIATVGHCTVDGNNVSVDYSGTSNVITYDLNSGQVRLYDIKVFYSTEGYVPPTLENISVENPQTQFTKGNSFVFGGKVIAHYDNGANEDVTSAAEFSGYSKDSVGEQTITVTYAGLTTTYKIKVDEPQAGAKSWKLVTDASVLKAGDVIRLGCSSKKKAAGAMGSQKYFASVDATYADGVMTSTTAIDITLGGSAGSWTLTTSEGTIGTSAAKALNKTGQGTKTWTIAITSAGVATIKSTTTTYGWIQYNASSPRFLNYASDQTSIEIYRYE